VLIAGWEALASPLEGDWIEHASIKIRNVIKKLWDTDLHRFSQINPNVAKAGGLQSPGV
jgi:hypothetical protein